jgi:pimeloyl-ACP methyl ester carboxylesterase
VEVQDWWSGGELVPLELSGTEQGVFVRREGSGPSMTLLHGFPSSSHDWAKIAPALAERYALTMPDLLGFGASSKPREHRYSLLEQADLVEALWEREGIESTVVVAHDYSVSVAQELLTRRAAGTLAVDLRALHFMNGGVYPDLHRPQPVQVALLDPEQGPQISAAMNGEVFMAGLAPTFPEGTRLGCRRRRDLAELPPAQRTAEHAPPDPLHRGPPRERRALDAGTRNDRRAADLRLGNARPGL